MGLRLSIENVSLLLHKYFFSTPVVSPQLAAYDTHPLFTVQKQVSFASPKHQRVSRYYNVSQITISLCSIVFSIEITVSRDCRYPPNKMLLFPATLFLLLLVHRCLSKRLLYPLRSPTVQISVAPLLPSAIT